MKNTKPVETLVTRILTHMQLFKENAELHLNKQTKAASARARKQISQLQSLLKEYRKVSVEVDKSE